MNRVNLVVERGKENQDLLAPFHIRSQCLIQVCLAWSLVVVNLLDKIFGFKVLLTDLLFRLVTFLYICLHIYDIYFYISFLYYIL